MSVMPHDSTAAAHGKARAGGEAGDASDRGLPSRVLVIAEAVTLAHVGRGITLARLLHERGAAVTLACDARAARFTAELPFRVQPLRSISAEVFLAALAAGRAVYDERTLEAYAADDVALLEQERPDAVIGDFRLSLSATARHVGTPYINVTNAYWSPYARPRHRLPPVRGLRSVPPPARDALFRLARPAAFALHARPLDRLRRRFGLPPLRDVRRAYCDGDVTVYADVPAMVPLRQTPAHHHFIGPVAWSPEVPLPPWWDAMLSRGAPIYVSLGSSGAASRLPVVLDALRPLGHPIVVATAGRAQVEGGRDLFVTDYVPADQLLPHARLVVSNGGSPTSYQALTHGIPVLGIPGNMDQLLNMHFVERFGAGVAVREEAVTAARVGRAARRALYDPAVRARAAEAAPLVGALRPEHRLPAIVQSLGVRRSAPGMG
jgi:UDP:flavonoid glycosyltransferase YjiC (YdhE family)